MRKRFGVVETDGPETITVQTGPHLKPDFLATLLDCGMPDLPDRIFVLIKSPAIAKRCGAEYGEFELCYLGLPQDKCDILTGIPLIRVETREGINVNLVVWARAVSWRDAWAYFLNFYNAKASHWRMVTVRQEIDKGAQREKIAHRLADGMKLAFMQFEGFTIGAVTRGDDISVDDFPQFARDAIKALAAKGHRKLSHERLGKELLLHRDTVGKYLSRDQGLWTQLQKEFRQIVNERAG